jgi:hypothetical protein
MIVSKTLLSAAFLPLLLTIVSAQQGQRRSSTPSLPSRCESICLSVDLPKASTEEGSQWDKAVKIEARLVNSSHRTIKVRAAGDDWLFYDVMNSLDTLKKRYECHFCYFRSIKPKSEFKFLIYADDLDDIFAIRVRYYYADEPEESDRLIHYVSWMK